MFQQAGQPRYMGMFCRDPTMSLPRIGYLIDWFDSRVAERDEDLRALATWWENRRLVVEDQIFIGRNDDMLMARDVRSVPVVAGVLSERLPRLTVRVPGWFLGPGDGWDHQIEYQSHYHAEVAAHLHEDEIAAAWETYGRLLQAEPDCISAFVNLAELERRSGRLDEADRLLHEGLKRARGDGWRYGVADGQWWIHICCALARLGRAETTIQAEVLEVIQQGDLHTIGARLSMLGVPSQVSLATHAVFGTLDARRRIMLHAAMLIGHIWPLPPPSAHDDMTAEIDVVRLVDGALAQNHVARVAHERVPSKK